VVAGTSAGRPVLAIGECLIDLIADDGDLLTATSCAIREGGAPANVAVAIARLGVPSAFCGVVGDDPFGKRLRHLLKRERVDVSRLRATSEAETSMALAWTDEAGDGRFHLLRHADRLLSAADVDRAGIGDVAAIVVGSVALAAPPSREAIHRAVEIASSAGVPVVFDLNLRPSLWADIGEARVTCDPILRQATVIKLSLDDARGVLDAGEPAHVFAALADVDALAIVVTDGPRGVWLKCRKDSKAVAVSPFVVDAVEPTGAGDAFTAALVARLVWREWTAPDANDVRYAAAAGALATTRHGALDGLPTADELAAFLHKVDDGTGAAPGHRS
jgi:fructokinase